MSAPAASANVAKHSAASGYVPRIVHNIPTWPAPVNPGASRAARVARRNRMTEGLASSICPVHDKDFHVRSLTKLWRAQGHTRLILLCDHASQPDCRRSMATWGWRPASSSATSPMTSAPRDVTLGLAARLGGTAVLSRFSRLLIDPNRGMDDPDPHHAAFGRRGGARQPRRGRGRTARRIARFHQPYHQAIAAAMARREGAGPCAVPRLDPQLHAGLAGLAAALARRHPVGPRRGGGAAP